MDLTAKTLQQSVVVQPYYGISGSPPPLVHVKNGVEKRETQG